jgi:subtilisin family serine protease
MILRLGALSLALPLICVACPAWPQDSTLEPPATQYFLGKGSWGQDYSDQWALQRIGFNSDSDSAWRLVKRDAAPVVVAVIDTGLDWSHKNIDRGNLWRNANEVPSNGIDDDHNGYVDDVIGWDFFDHDNRPWDYDGHGTLVAGIIAGSWNDKGGMAGVNPFARLMVVKAINNFGHTRASYLAQAIAYAVDNGARVINLSVGGKQVTKVEQAAIDYAYAKGVTVVMAAGNEGVELSNYGVAGSEKVLTVGATGFDDQRVVFSNWGNVSVAAPGLDVLSLRARRTDVMLGMEGVKYTARAAYVGADKRHYRASGTSFSAPLVSGLISLMLGNDPNLTNRQIMTIVKSTARDVGTPGVDQYTGYGVVDANAALKAPRDYILLAGINRVEVVQTGGKQVVRVHGTVDADAPKSARIEIGQGEAPTSWKSVATANKGADPDSVLGDIPADALKGAAVWQIRIIVEHENGSKREARFKLTLG